MPHNSMKMISSAYKASANSDNSDNSGGSDSASGDQTQAEAQEIMDSIVDRPEVCHALYKLLQEKYSGDGKDSKNPTPPRPDNDVEMSEEDLKY